MYEKFNSGDEVRVQIPEQISVIGAYRDISEDLRAKIIVFEDLFLGKHIEDFPAESLERGISKIQIDGGEKRVPTAFLKSESPHEIQRLENKLREPEYWVGDYIKTSSPLADEINVILGIDYRYPVHRYTISPGLNSDFSIEIGRDEIEELLAKGLFRTFFEYGSIPEEGIEDGDKRKFYDILADIFMYNSLS